MQEAREGVAQDTAHSSHLWDAGTFSQLQQAGSYLREKVMFRKETGNSFHSQALVKADAIWFLNPHLFIVTVSENVCWYLCYARVTLIINYSSMAYGAFSKEPAGTSPLLLTDIPVLTSRGPALCCQGAARTLQCCKKETRVCSTWDCPTPAPSAIASTCTSSTWKQAHQPSASTNLLTSMKQKEKD